MFHFLFFLLFINDLLVEVLVTASIQKPNIVFVVLDDIGWSDLSYNNNRSSFSTPQIDELANRGIKFENYYVHPTCTPTRAALLTGLYSANTGLTIAAMPGSTVGLPLHLPTLPQLLRQRGYDCHMVGKWHLGNAQWAQTPVGRGFQSFVGSLLSQFDSYNKQMVKPNGEPIAVDWMLAYENRSFVHFLDRRHATTAITDGTRQIIESYSHNSKGTLLIGEENSSSLFLYVAFTAAHAPLQPLPEHAEQCVDVDHPWRRGMCGMVKGLDEAVGNISQYIVKELGSNSVLVVTSDNGGAPWFGGLNEPLRGGKTSPFEGGVRVPAFAVDFTSNYIGNGDSGVGLYLGECGRWHKNLIHVTDWLPTFLAWAKGNNNNNSGVDDIDILLQKMDGFDMSSSFLRLPSFTTPPLSHCEESSGSGEASSASSRCTSRENIEAKNDILSQSSIYVPRSDVLLDMYYAGEAIWTNEEVVAIRSGKWKLIQGNARDPHWYTRHSSWRLISSNNSWPILLGELMIRCFEPLMGISQFDTLRAVIIWSWVHSFFLEYDTYLFDIESDPSERNNLEKDHPEIVAELLEKANHIKLNRPLQSEYWMVVPNFQKTLIAGICSSSTNSNIFHDYVLDRDDDKKSDEPIRFEGSDKNEEKEYCLFAHPFVNDDSNPADMELLHTKAVAQRLIKEMIVSVLKYTMGAFLVAIFTAYIYKVFSWK